MQYYESVLDLVGKTPLVKLHRVTEGIRAQVFAKMESYNPRGSFKDRIGVSMVEAAERDGSLKPGGTIVEATSGNTGIGLALAAAIKGYKCIFVMTEKASVEKGRYLKALGADVVICPVAAKPGSPDHYVTTARRIAAETPNSFYPDQYSNPNNPEAHYRTTGPELWEQTDGRITHFVAGLGTGGTISGTARYLKEKSPAIRVVGADPYGSVFKTFKETGQLTEATPYMVEGIGQEVIPENVHIKYVDEIVNVTDRESFELSRQLGRLEGIFCGGSTGTNLGAALKVARTLDESGVVVFIVCDTGERYLTKHLSDEWMREKRLLEPQRISASLLVKTKTAAGPSSLVAVAPSDSIGDVLTLMQDRALSLIPVLEDGRSVGSLRENRLLTCVLANRDLLGQPVSEVMDPSFPMVDDEASMTDVARLLQKSPAILVEEYGRIAGILTRHDLLDVPQAN
ncbi:MAG TPA: pyridoxal-phosphate dependent enzyme [Blastocatellia bacterium]|nr:pyridoxal-phosphate dependent enzyme [Blastocatellia bacterium]